MRESEFNTIKVPRIDGNQFTSDNPGADTSTPAPIWRAGPRPMRVLVRNLSVGAYVLLAYDPATLQRFPSTGGTFMLPAGLSEVFVLAPNQGLYASTPVAGVVEVSVAISDALPIV